MSHLRVLLVFAFVLLLGVGQSAAQIRKSGTISADPSPTAPHIGDTFTVAITASDISDPISGIELAIGFDPTIVQFRHVVSGNMLHTTGRESVCATPDVATQTVRVACVTTGEQVGATGSGTLLTLTFEAVGIGVSDITLDAPLLTDSNRPPTPFTASTISAIVTVEQIPTTITLNALTTTTPTMWRGLLLLLIGLGAVTVRAWRRSRISRWQTTVHLLLIASLACQTFLPLIQVQPLFAAATTTHHAPRTTSPRSPLSNFFADLNGDQRVDLNDLQQIVTVWNCGVADGCYSADFDYNTDNQIDLIDLATVANEYDVAPPTLSITAPTANAIITGSTLNVTGTFADAHAVTEILVNGTAATLGSGVFSADLTLTDGTLPIHVSALDGVGQTSGATRLVTVDGAGPFITINQPPNRQSVYTTRPTIAIDYTDLVGLVNENTLLVTLTDEGGNVSDVTGVISADGSSATGTLNFDLSEDQAYTLTVSVQDNHGLQGTHATNFYVPQNANTITPPTRVDGAGFVSGIVYDSTSCAGTQEFDPLNCTGLRGAMVTLEKIDAGALPVARSSRQADLITARSPFGLPHRASRAPQQVAQTVVGTIVTGRDGFFAFPVAETGNYAVRVEKDGFTYGQRLTDIVLDRSTPTTDIFLTPLDAAVTPCDSGGCQHTSSDGQMQLAVPAGALTGTQQIDIRATQFDQVQFLPSGELPPGTGETYAFNLSGAAEITFTQPITVMLKNDRGFPAGDQVPLGYWNQTLQVWEHAGHATIDPTGEWLVMQVTHFSNFDPNDPVSNATADVSGSDETAKPGDNCKADCDSSQIEIASGALRQEFQLPTVNVLDEPMGVTMLYDSTRANPNGVIDIGLKIEALSEVGLGEFDLIMAELFIEGESTEQFSFAVNEIEQDGEIGRFRFFWDGRDAQDRQMPPGIYRYTVKTRIPYAAQFFFSLNGRFGGPPDLTRPTGVTTNGFIDNVIVGTVLLGGDPETHYGQGWQVADVQRLFSAEDGSVLIDDGDQVLTEYLMPAFNRLADSPTVRTLGREELGVGSGEWDVGSGEGSEQLTESEEALTESDNFVLEPDAQSADQSSIVNRQSSIPSTDITTDILTDTTWTLANSPYRVLNDITIAATATLTVEAGVVVNVHGTSTVFDSIFIDGTLLAQGTAGAPVIFTSQNDNTNPAWGGIRVQNGGHATLHHTQIRFAGQTAGTLGREAALAIVDSSAVLSETLIFDSLNFNNDPDACLHISNSQVTVNAVTLDQCSSPGNEDRAALDIVGNATTITATNGLTVTNSSRYPLATQWDLLDQLPAITTDGSGRDMVRILNSTISDDVTIATVGTLNTFNYDQNVTIGAGQHVTVTAGVQLEARSSSNLLTVQGRLTTAGADGNPVILTSDDNDPTNNGGAEWRGILVDGGSADLAFTTIRFAGSVQLHDISRNAAIAVRNGGTLHLRDSLLLQNNDTDLRDDAVVLSENSDTLIERTVINNDLFTANPRRGVEVLGSGAFALNDSTIIHRINPLRVPFSQLAGVTDDNNFVTNLPNARIELTGATLSDDLTISPYIGLAAFHTFGTLTIATGTTLSLTAGTLLQAQNSNADVIVRGRLVATGTETQNVILTSQTDGGSTGEWGGVFVDGGSADLTFTTLRFAGQMTIPGKNTNAALAVVNGTLNVSNSTFFRNGDTSGFDDAALYIENSTANVQGTIISDDDLPNANPSHGLILVDGGAMDLTFENNILIQNDKHIKMPTGLLPRISGTNLFSDDNNQRITLANSVINDDVTIAPVGNLNQFEFLFDVTVRSEMTIAAGVTLLMRQLVDLFVDGGTLTAVGEVDRPITFVGSSQINWNGIVARNGAAVELAHADISRAVRGLHTTDSRVSLYKNNFHDNERAIQVNGTVPTFFARANSFDNNSTTAVSNFSATEIDMRLNFWGSPNGPFHPANPLGDGEVIQGGALVLITPFLTNGDNAGNTAVNRTPHDTTLLIRDETTGSFTRHYPDGSLVIFNSDGLHTTTRDTNGNEIRYNYNANNSLATLEFVASGRGVADWVWTFTYDVVRGASSTNAIRNTQSTIHITDPANRETTLTIDKNGDLVSLQEPGLSAPMTFAYGATHNMTHKTDARGNTTAYVYDAIGRITQSILPPREIYDPVSGTFSTVQEVHDFAPAVTDGQVVNGLAAGDPAAPNPALPQAADIRSTQQINGRSFEFATNAFGAPTNFSDAFGNETVTVRDERDNVTKITFPSGICSEFSYDDFNQMTSETLIAPDQCELSAEQRDPARILVTTHTYEPRFNRRKTTTDALGRTTTMVFDYEVGQGEAGNVVQVIYPAVEDGEAGRALVNPVESFEYNAAGQVTRTVDVRGVATCMVYTTGDPSEANTLFVAGVTPVPGLLTERIEDCGGALQRSFVFRQFDAAGYALTAIEYAGTAQARTTTQTRDLRNRLNSETDPIGSITTYSYDNGDNALALTLTGHDGQVLTTEYTYNALDDVTRIRESGDDGTTRTLLFGYDLNRNETLSQDYNGNQERSLYDANDRLQQTIDAAGNVTTYTYNEDGRQLTITNPLGAVRRFVYDHFGREVANISDAGGLNLTLQFAYDAVGNITRTTDPTGVATCFTYDALDRRTRMNDSCDELNKLTTVTYTLAGDPVTTTDALGRTKRMVYDAHERVTQTTDALGNVATISYDLADNLIMATDEVGQVVEMAYDTLDRLVETTDALGGTVTLQYDAFDQLLAQTDELARTYQYEYDGLNRRTAVIDPLGKRSEYRYDDNDNVLAVTDPRGMTTQYTFDPFDLVTQILYPDGSTFGYEYDGNLNTLREIDGFGNATTLIYDAAERIIGRIDRDGQQTTYELDAAGNMLAEIDPLGNRTEQVFDRLYRVVALNRPNGESVSYTYDLLGNLLTLTDALNNTTTWTYDALDRPLTQTNQLGDTRTWSYAADGKLTRYVDRNGNDFSFTYDSLRRLTLETETNSGATRSMSYDAASQLIGAQDAQSHYTLGFDARGDGTTVIGRYTTGSPDIRYSYVYDAVGNVVRRFEMVGNVNTSTTDFVYDELEQMTRQLQQSAVTQQIEMAYDANGRMTQLARFHNGTLAVATSYSFAADDFISEVRHTTPARTVRSFSYAYDADNRITSKTTEAGQSTYGYDGADQVTSATHAFQADENYSYDNNGNRTLANHTIGQDNRLTSDGAFDYEYDAEGNLTRKTAVGSGASLAYTWDHLNRLVSVVSKDGGGAVVQTVSYSYDVFNHRISKTVNGITEHYGHDGANLTLVLDAVGNITNRYLYAPQVDMVLSDERVDGVRWLLAEVNGSISDVLDSGGGLLNQIHYDSFGNITTQSNSAEQTRWGFTGRERDTESGLYHYRTRYYDGGIGRFISQDKLGFNGGDTNLYRYAANDSVNDRDPFGTNPGTMSAIARGIKQAKQQALANNVQPTRKPVTPGFMDRIANFALDATIFLTDNAVTNAADSFFSGQSSQLTFGLTDSLRESIYGEHATKNHTGGFRTAGEIFGFAQSFFLPGANLQNLAKVKGLLQAGEKGRATLMALALALSTEQRVAGGVAMQNAINAVIDDPCLSEEEKAQKLVDIMSNTRAPKPNQVDKSNPPPPNSKKNPPLEKTRKRNLEQDKEQVKKYKDQKDYEEAVKDYEKYKADEQKYQQELKDYLKKRSDELRKKESVEMIDKKQKQLQKDIRSENERTVNDAFNKGEISQKRRDELLKANRDMGGEELRDTDFRGIINNETQSNKVKRKELTMEDLFGDE